MLTRALTLALTFSFGLTLVACDKKEDKKDAKADDKKTDDKKADDKKDGGEEKADGGW
jgi:hypothetical protein